MTCLFVYENREAEFAGSVESGEDSGDLSRGVKSVRGQSTEASIGYGVRKTLVRSDGAEDPR